MRKDDPQTTNLSAWRERRDQLRLMCESDGHVIIDELDCCERCQLPLEFFVNSRPAKASRIKQKREADSATSL